MVSLICLVRSFFSVVVAVSALYVVIGHMTANPAEGGASPSIRAVVDDITGSDASFSSIIL